MRCEFCCRIYNSAKKLGITFHNFPKDRTMRNAWIKACVSRGCELEENMNVKTNRLCSNHFTVNDFEEDPSLVRRKLKKNVVPTRFSRKPFIYCIACSDVVSEYSDTYLHEFPEDATLRKKWADMCRQNGFDLKKIILQYALCSNHFSTNCFIEDNQGRKYLKQDAVPLIFASSFSSSKYVEQCEKPMTRTNVSGNNPSSVEEWDYTVQLLFSTSTASCGDISTNSAGTTDLIGNTSQGDTSPVTTISPKRRLPFTDNNMSKTSPKCNKKLKIWRPARAGDLREEHFNSPREARRNFHILSSKCKYYKNQLSNYRSEIWRLKLKIKTMENLFSQLTEKNLISEETAAEISGNDIPNSQSNIAVDSAFIKEEPEYEFDEENNQIVSTEDTVKVELQDTQDGYAHEYTSNFQIHTLKNPQ